MYNLLSDKLDIFEREVRKIRNKIVATLMNGALILSRYIFTKCKQYIHTDFVKSFRDLTLSMVGEIDKELELRRKLGN